MHSVFRSISSAGGLLHNAVQRMLALANSYPEEGHTFGREKVALPVLHWSTLTACCCFSYSLSFSSVSAARTQSRRVRQL